MLLAGWSDAAFGTHAQDGRCRLGYIIGLTSSTLAGPVHILQWASKFTRKHVKSSPGGEIFALSEMRGNIEMIRELYSALGHEKLGSYRLLDCESLSPHLRTGRLGTEKISHPGTEKIPHYRSILGARGGGDLGNVARIPGNENPADGLTKATSDRGQFSHSLGRGIFVWGVRNNCAACRFSEKCSLPRFSVSLRLGSRLHVTCLSLAAEGWGETSDRVILRQELEAVLRAH